MIEAFILLSFIGCSACTAFLYFDRLDRQRVKAETEKAKNELKEILEKISVSHNEMVMNLKTTNDKVNQMDLRIAAVAASQQAQNPQAFRGVR